MPTGVDEPGREGGAEVGGFEASGGELIEGVPFETDPLFRRGEGFSGGDALDGQLEDQVDLGFLLTLLKEAMFTAAQEMAGLRGAAELLPDLAHQGLAGGFAEINMAAGQVGDA